MEMCFKVSAKLLARRARVRAAAEARLADRDAWLKRVEALNHGKLKNNPRYNKRG